MAILFTGITGTVGQDLGRALACQGQIIVSLVRGENPQERLERIFGRVPQGVEVLKGNIVLPCCGVSDSDISLLKGRVDKIVHCASSIKFDKLHERETQFINIGGTKNVLELAEEIGCKELHYISTAYVAGDAQRLTEDKLYIGQNFRNPYESTKAEAEQMVRGWNCGRHSIYRISIVVGNSLTGHTTGFSGYYGFFSGVWNLIKTLKKMNSEKLERCKTEEGIFLDSEGVLHLPICGNFGLESTLNVIPIDWTVKMLFSAIQLPAEDLTFHVVHPSPPEVRWLNDVSLKHLGVTGFKYRNLNGKWPESTGRIQKFFNRNTDLFDPYTTHEAGFEVSNLPKILGKDYESPPIVDEEFLARMIKYAKSVDFGRSE